MSAVLDIPVLEQPIDPSQVIGEAMKTTSDILQKGFKDVKKFFGLVSNTIPSNKDVKQTSLFTKESLKFYQDTNKGKLTKAKKTELKSLSDMAKQETESLMGFGDVIGDSISKPLLPSLASMATGFFDFRDEIKKNVEDLKKELSIGLNSLIPQGLKDVWSVIKDRSNKDDKQDRGENKYWNASKKFFKSSLAISIKMLKSMGNWIFDLILFFIALAIFDPSGSFMMSILEMLFNIGMMLLNMLIAMIPKIIAMIPPIIQKLVDAFVKALPKIMTALMQLLEGFGKIIETIIKSLVDNLPKIIPSLIDSFIKLFIKLIGMIGKLLPQLIVMLANSVGMVIEELTKNIEPIINAIIDALPLIAIALIKAIIILIPILAKALWTTFFVLSKAIGKILLKVFIIIPTLIIKMWSWIFNKLASMFEGTKIGEIFKSISKIFEKIGNIGAEIARTLNLSGVSDKISQMFSDLWDWLGDRFPFNLFKKGSDNYAQKDVEKIFETSGEGDKLFKNLIKGDVSKTEDLKKLDEIAKALEKSGLKDMTGEGKVDNSDLQMALKNGNKDVVDALKNLRNKDSSRFTSSVFTVTDIKSF
jgi:hypothetical protein